MNISPRCEEGYLQVSRYILKSHSRRLENFMYIENTMAPLQLFLFFHRVIWKMLYMMFYCRTLHRLIRKMQGFSIHVYGQNLIGDEVSFFTHDFFGIGAADLRLGRYIIRCEDGVSELFFVGTGYF